MLVEIVRRPAAQQRVRVRDVLAGGHVERHDLEHGHRGTRAQQPRSELGVHSEIVPGPDDEHVAVPARKAVSADLDRVAATLGAAFASDPLWTWAFPGGDKLDVWWRFLVQSALRYPCVWLAGDYEAVSVWIPPGASELTDAEEERVGPLLEELIGPRAHDVMDVLERFEESHPRDRPHYYLSLLGTHPEQRGHGVGMRLLAENLAQIDEQAMPAYLESSNPANDRRYEGVGFERIGSFTTPDASHTVSTMWREPRG
jgi:GNAT superfamily N-acetyltransferase